MAVVKFQHAGVSHRVEGRDCLLIHDVHHARCHVVLLRRQNKSLRALSSCQNDLPHLAFSKQSQKAFGEGLIFLLALLFNGLVPLRRLVKARVVFCEVNKPFVAEVLHLRDDVLINSIRHEKNLHVTLQRLFNVRRLPHLLNRVTCEEVNVLLFWLHAVCVLLQANKGAVTLCGCVTQQLREAAAVVGILENAETDMFAKLSPELWIQGLLAFIVI
ncbi:hypothetical protein ECC02_005558 [Trypanosoma cruzi]|uniref:Uncharacterized protein n=1 Tax=Trypanosoma cruzi TaxID=5693 RepID=A0A7J6Y4T9_TRYCR|nr:hypothetical protein ECC02_005558 [Trypanosoma cruzi]